MVIAKLNWCNIYRIARRGLLKTLNKVQSISQHAVHGYTVLSMFSLPVGNTSTDQSKLPYLLSVVQRNMNNGGFMYRKSSGVGTDQSQQKTIYTARKSFVHKETVSDLFSSVDMDDMDM